jgi:hypothetical protein
MKDLEVKEAVNQPVKTEKKSDVQRFIDHYQPSKYKVLRNGIEVRSVTDVEGSSLKATNLIKSLKLGLLVVRDAELAQRGCFEVREVKR